MKHSCSETSTRCSTLHIFQYRYVMDHCIYVCLQLVKAGSTLFAIPCSAPSKMEQGSDDVTMRYSLHEAANQTDGGLSLLSGSDQCDWGGEDGFYDIWPDTLDNDRIDEDPQPDEGEDDHAE